jgi:hypothetical protein
LTNYEGPARTREQTNDATIASVADDLKCGDLAAHCSEVGRVFVEMPEGMPQQTLIWQYSGISPQQLDFH